MVMKMEGLRYGNPKLGLGELRFTNYYVLQEYDRYQWLRREDNFSSESSEKKTPKNVTPQLPPEGYYPPRTLCLELTITHQWIDHVVHGN